jgi:hypothetical protein
MIQIKLKINIEGIIQKIMTMSKIAKLIIRQNKKINRKSKPPIKINWTTPKEIRNCFKKSWTCDKKRRINTIPKI